MKIYLFITTLLFMGCVGSATKEVSSNKARPVKCIIATSSEFIERDFAALSTPMMAVNLAFKSSGQVVSIPVAKGEEVYAGELLCRIDPNDIELQLISDRSRYEEAESGYDRARRLMEYEAISQQDVERAKSAYLTAKSIFENTQELLGQTQLVAPFDAVVERVYVDEYQRVQAGEAVMRIVTPTTRNVEFTLPEGSLPQIKDSLTRFTVRFDNIANVSFEASVTEYARTSSDASGFPVTLELYNPDPRRYSISSGMSCTVTMLSPDRDHRAVVLPLSAIYSPTSGGTYVWVVDSLDRVIRRSVDVQGVTGSQSVIVDSGVESGECVVVAGVYQLVDNERVKPLR